jgi:3-dehydroquinate dehydratase/shikimate dehydrogenase
MLMAVIRVHDVTAALQQIQAISSHVDGFEFRFDDCHHWYEDEIAILRRAIHLPVIFTLRKASQGGHYQGTEADRLKKINALCTLEPDFLDLEYDVPAAFIEQLHADFPSIKLICSYHHFTETPTDLHSILLRMQHPAYHVYKIATKANSTLDALRMLLFIQTVSQKHQIVGIAMGELGVVTRVAGSIVGNVFTYAAISTENVTAPGQLTVTELNEIYHIKKLNKETKIYALLGDPITVSVGHLLHNAAIRILKENAVYLKLQVSKADLSETVLLCRKLPVVGFSITMPLKEAVLSLVDELSVDASRMQAINSIIVKSSRWLGFNTDGEGAMLALAEQMTLDKQTILLLGAGGAAKAIACAAQAAGASVMIVNRSLQKAETLAHSVNGQAYVLDQLPIIANLCYSVFINTLPTDLLNKPLLASLCLKEGTYVMDIVYQPIQTPLLKVATKAGCTIIPGYQMYVHQALLQLKCWFQLNIEQLRQLKKMMQDYFTKIVE